MMKKIKFFNSSFKKDNEMWSSRSQSYKRYFVFKKSELVLHCLAVGYSSEYLATTFELFYNDPSGTRKICTL
jgi:hypothetical protein